MNTKKGKKRSLMLIAVCLLAGTLVTGCASHTESVHKETVSSPASPATQTVTVDKQVTTTEHHDYGILGGAFHVVGEILAFPFDVVASLFRFIF